MLTSWEESAASAIPVDEPISLDKPPADGAPVCATCGEIIDWTPEKGKRRPKYHPGHRPSDVGKTGGVTRRTSKGPRNRAEREADEIATKLRRQLVTLAVFVSMVEPFDGQAIFAGAKPLSDNAGTVLQNSERARALLLSSKQATGWLGLVGAFLLIAVPISAHHGLIPKEIKRRGQPPMPVGELLEQIPSMLLKLERKMADAEQTIAEKVAEAQANADT